MEGEPLPPHEENIREVEEDSRAERVEEEFQDNPKRAAFGQPLDELSDRPGHDLV
jgi:hypothetical protein